MFFTLQLEIKSLKLSSTIPVVKKKIISSIQENSVLSKQEVYPKPNNMASGSRQKYVCGPLIWTRIINIRRVLNCSLEFKHVKFLVKVFSPHIRNRTSKSQTTHLINMKFCQRIPYNTWSNIVIFINRSRLHAANHA